MSKFTFTLRQDDVTDAPWLQRRHLRPTWAVMEYKDGVFQQSWGPFDSKAKAKRYLPDIRAMVESPLPLSID